MVFSPTIFFNNTYIASPRIEINGTWYEQMGQSTVKQHYRNCNKCLSFSGTFGNITSEEEFEIVKGKFVKHFNEVHHDIIQPKPIRKYKKVPNSTLFIGNGIWHFNCAVISTTHETINDLVQYNATHSAMYETQQNEGARMREIARKKREEKERNQNITLININGVDVVTTEQRKEKNKSRRGFR